MAQLNRRYIDEINALQIQNISLQAKIDSLERELDKLKGETVFIDWNDLEGVESDEQAFYGKNEYGESLSVEDSELAARIRLSAPFLIIPYRQTIRDYVDFYTVRKRRSLPSILKRYDSASPVLLQAFRKHGVPTEIAALVIVESAVSPKATSKAGAHGYWQFMPVTAAEYGLSIESGNDEREDLVKSSDAAARYLAKAYSALGSWPLAVLSYNCGPGNMNKALIKAGRNADFWAVYEHLPKETKGYLPSLLAVRYILKYRTELGF